MSSAKLSQGTLLQLSDNGSPAVFTSVAEITKIAVGSNERDVIDVTHMESGIAREFIAGLLDGAVVSLDLNFLPANATHLDLTTNIQATTSIFRTYRICWSDFGTGNFTATVNTGTDVWTTAAHSWLTGQPITITTSGTLPASTPQIEAGKPYYVRRTSSTEFTLHPTSADAVANTNVINFTSAGTGTHTANGGTSWTFSANVTGFQSAAPVADKLTASPTFKITSSISIAP